ncbi:MAG: nucleotidyltransferase domain-containing protein [Deltaproteobacteria bacterium]|nr:nucleotidyltransferase domain-containing protein [Deltaproteobacteria bacterium]
MNKNLIQKLGCFFQKRREIKLAYLFGSEAKRPHQPSRDVDIAVLLNKSLRGLQQFDYRVQLCQGLEDFLHSFKQTLKVDLVLLNEADPFLTYQVLKYGQLLFERQKKSDRDFKVRSMTRYFDAKPLHDFFFERALKH